MNILEKFKPIRTFIFDVDGVLTDGKVLLLENGLQARTINIKDGLALQMALKNNYRVVIVSGASSEPVIHRFQYLGIQEVHLGISDKLKFAEHFLSIHSIEWNEVLFMGDDLPDIPLIERAGLGCCPGDAASDVIKISSYISPVNGGMGCVRDVIEKVLKLNGHWIFNTTITSR
jgi:3-deoxy-D-manno-octulosonate 8-phosphate phosphatase (KDO 8-P phosphatase)